MEPLHGKGGSADESQQNAGFHAVHLCGRAYVTAKWAMTRNGRFATGDPDLIHVGTELRLR